MHICCTCCIISHVVCTCNISYAQHNISSCNLGIKKLNSEGPLTSKTDYFLLGAAWRTLLWKPQNEPSFSKNLEISRFSSFIQLMILLYGCVLVNSNFLLLNDYFSFGWLGSGGTISESERDLRVNGVLAATRGLGNHGDPALKKCVIIDPYTTCVKIDQHAQFLILATNSVWEVFSPEEAASLLIQVRMKLSMGHAVDACPSVESEIWV